MPVHKSHFYFGTLEELDELILTNNNIVSNDRIKAFYLGLREQYLHRSVSFSVIPFLAFTDEKEVQVLIEIFLECLEYEDLLYCEPDNLPL